MMRMNKNNKFDFAIQARRTSPAGSSGSAECAQCGDAANTFSVYEVQDNRYYDLDLNMQQTKI